MQGLLAGAGFLFGDETLILFGVRSVERLPCCDSVPGLILIRSNVGSAFRRFRARAVAFGRCHARTMFVQDHTFARLQTYKTKFHFEVAP